VPVLHSRMKIRAKGGQTEAGMTEDLKVLRQVDKCYFLENTSPKRLSNAVREN
jgi:hypothetical protein